MSNQPRRSYSTPSFSHGSIRPFTSSNPPDRLSAPLPPSVSRTTHPTPLASPLLHRSEAFGLGGFFPSHPGQEERGWFQEEYDDFSERETGTLGERSKSVMGLDLLGMPSLTSTPGTMSPSFPDTPGPGHYAELAMEPELREFDAFAREIIKSEDKMGVLAITAHNLPSFFATNSPFDDSSSLTFSIDEPTDHESLYAAILARRSSASTTPAVEIPTASFGELFFSVDGVEPEQDFAHVRAWSTYLLTSAKKAVGW